MAILFSGIQPTGQLILGNYLGAIKHWRHLQDQHTCYFAIVDLHALTTFNDPAVLRTQCYDALALCLACGIDPHKSTLFIQSQVPMHCELAWILNCYTAMGALSRMTQYKEKSQQAPGRLLAGLFTYPVLMAADILLYQANLVPVGHDQKQHLELCRDLAEHFNQTYGPTFTVPTPHIPTYGARIMGLQDPTKKMSKSDTNPYNAIRLLDPPELIAKKLARAVTDSEHTIIYDPNQKPGIANLLTLLAAITAQPMAALEERYANKNYHTLKQAVAEVIIDLLTPIQKRYQAIRPDHAYLTAIMQASSVAAQEQASKTLRLVREKIGLIN